MWRPVRPSVSLFFFSSPLYPFPRTGPPRSPSRKIDPITTEVFPTFYWRWTGTSLPARSSPLPSSFSLPFVLVPSEWLQDLFFFPWFNSTVKADKFPPLLPKSPGLWHETSRLLFPFIFRVLNIPIVQFFFSACLVFSLPSPRLHQLF